MQACLQIYTKCTHSCNSCKTCTIRTTWITARVTGGTNLQQGLLLQEEQLLLQTAGWLQEEKQRMQRAKELRQHTQKIGWTRKPNIKETRTCSPCGLRWAIRKKNKF